MPPPESVEDRPETGHDDDPEALPPEPPFWAGEQCDLFPDDEDEMGSAALEKTFASNGTVTAKKPGWSEGDHPRGQPDNAGQFGAGGSGKPAGGKPKPGAKPADKPAQESAGGDDKRMSDQAREIVKKIKPTKQRAFTGVAVGGKIDGRLAGAIGEEVLIQHLKSLGYTDAGQTSDFLNDKHNNLAFDLIHDHRLIEAKAGQASNPDGVWALKYDGKFTKDQEAKFAKMTPEKVKLAKKKINAAKVKGIHDRKAAFIERMNKNLGFKVKAGMMTVIINPDTKTADIFQFDGLHDRIPFKSEMTESAYVGSVKYGG